MEPASTLVIKVKYGDMLRRFNARIVGEELDLTVDGLREKILSLFSFAPDVELILTYIDEDGDAVHLVDADDLHDAAKQGLNPLRITARLSSEPKASQSSHSTGSSTPRSSQGQRPLQNLHADVAEILRTLPGPLCEALVNFSSDISSKALLSSPYIAELVDSFSKVGLSYLGQHSDSQTIVQPAKNNEPENSLSQAEKNESNISRVDAGMLETQLTGSQVHSSQSSGSLKKVPVKGDVKNEKPEPRKELEKLRSRLRCLEKYVSSARGSRNACSGKKEKIKIKDPKLVNQNLCLEKKHGESSYKSSHPGNDLPSEEGNKPRESHVEPKATRISAIDPKLSVPSMACGSAISGIPDSDNLPSPIVPANQECLFRKSRSHVDGTQTVFHCGVRCDGCGIHPITGPRFKSKVKFDYDLCSICFSEMGNSTDYIRMDRPAVYRNHAPLVGFPNYPQSRPQACSKSSKKSRPTKLDSHFVEDVNVFDGTVMAPSTSFTKIWRMRNSGTLDWPQGTQLVWIGGYLLRNDLSVKLEIPMSGIPIDQELDIAVDFIAPERPGRYASYWRMVSPYGQQFGQRVWVHIQVNASVENMHPVSIIGLNLNLPPVSCSLPGSPGSNLDPVPVVEDAQLQTENKKMTVELVEPVVHLQPDDKFQEMKFPINDNLLLETGASNTVFKSPSDSFSVIHKNDPQPPPEYESTKESALEVPVKSGASDSDQSAGVGVVNPVIHAFDAMPPVTPSASPQESAAELLGKEEVEEKLLRELEEMGFKEIDLNKEILKANEYDLEQAVDDLCNVSDWDPILEELEEMGFHDAEMNKKLLEKNDGSMVHVVMDLIAREKKNTSV